MRMAPASFAATSEKPSGSPPSGVQAVSSPPVPTTHRATPRPEVSPLAAASGGNIFGAACVGVLVEAFLIIAVAFPPALGAALAIYAVVRSETLLPLSLGAPQLGAVLAITLVMAAASAFLSLSGLRRADPAESF